MKIGVLTSSRADFGIYLPLLSKLKIDPFFEIEIIAFGTHLSKLHGFTLIEIESEGLSKIHRISNLISNDDEESIATSYAITAFKFAEFWTKNEYDLVLCLGDRFEMNAAVQSGIPFGVKFAHFHGGETTLGAIDNIYRHQITLASTLHFTSTAIYKYKVSKLLGDSTKVYDVGSLSIDSIRDFRPVDKDIFYKKFEITHEHFALVTFHPETLAKEKNQKLAIEMNKALTKISAKLFLVMTMPIADTLGSIFRDQIQELKIQNPDKIMVIENFGKVNYFSAIYYSRLLIGNTSSGIIEAASFRKYVLNVGDRQKGRARSANVFDTPFDEKRIEHFVRKILKLGPFGGKNIYSKTNTVNTIIETIKSYNETL